MLTELQTKKFEYLFKVHDTNNNGVLEFNDFSLYVSKFASTYSLSNDSTSFQKLSESARYWWELIQQVADLDNDQLVTKTEWMKYADIYTNMLDNHPDRAKYLCDFVMMIFDLIDETKNGEISANEYANFLSAWNIDSDAKKCFEKIDTDGNGIMTRQDMVDRAFEFYLSNDINAPGNHFYGLIENL